jgi:hypothetical protein
MNGDFRNRVSQLHKNLVLYVNYITLSTIKKTRFLYV